MMKRTGTLTTRMPRAPRAGFTLVELMVVIVIIGILAAIATPVAFMVINRAKQARVKMEVDGLVQALEAYNLKYGDYPPDFSSSSAAERHFRKIFPQISSSELALLGNMMTINGSFSGEAVDRAEALVFALGGFSDDPQRPFTGTGGPFVLIDPNNIGSMNPAHYQYNSERANSLFTFDPGRLTYGLLSSGGVIATVSYDEAGLQEIPAVDQDALPRIWTSNPRFNGDALPPNDLMPVYLQEDGVLPLVYFDSRTYSVSSGSGSPPASLYNYYYPNPEFGVARPYKSTEINSNWSPLQPGDRALFYEGKNSYQIIAPGLDNHYGGIFEGPNGSGRQIVWTYPNGRPWNGETVTSLANVIAGTEGFMGTINGYADNQIDRTIELNYQLDNITSFSQQGILENSLEE